MPTMPSVATRFSLRSQEISQTISWFIAFGVNLLGGLLLAVRKVIAIVAVVIVVLLASATGALVLMSKGNDNTAWTFIIEDDREQNVTIPKYPSV